jgi:excisionase family DNA binding protein
VSGIWRFSCSCKSDQALTEQCRERDEQEQANFASVNAKRHIATSLHGFSALCHLSRKVNMELSSLQIVLDCYKASSAGMHTTKHLLDVEETLVGLPMRTHISPSPNVLTLAEIMNWLGISRTTLYKLCQRNEIPHFKVGREYRFNREQITKWMEQRPTRPSHNLNRHRVQRRS